MNRYQNLIDMIISEKPDQLPEIARCLARLADALELQVHHLEKRPSLLPEAWEILRQHEAGLLNADRG